MFSVASATSPKELPFSVLLRLIILSSRTRIIRILHALVAAKKTSHTSGQVQSYYGISKDQLLTIKEEILLLRHITLKLLAISRFIVYLGQNRVHIGHLRKEIDVFKEQEVRIFNQNGQNESLAAFLKTIAVPKYDLPSTASYQKNTDRSIFRHHHKSRLAGLSLPIKNPKLLSLSSRDDLVQIEDELREMLMVEISNKLTNCRIPSDISIIFHPEQGKISMLKVDRFEISLSIYRRKNIFAWKVFENELTLHNHESLLPKSIPHHQKSVIKEYHRKMLKRAVNRKFKELHLLRENYRDESLTEAISLVHSFIDGLHFRLLIENIEEFLKIEWKNIVSIDLKAYKRFNVAINSRIPEDLHFLPDSLSKTFPLRLWSYQLLLLRSEYFDQKSMHHISRILENFVLSEINYFSKRIVDDLYLLLRNASGDEIALRHFTHRPGIISCRFPFFPEILLTINKLTGDVDLGTQGNSGKKLPKDVHRFLHNLSIRISEPIHRSGQKQISDLMQNPDFASSRNGADSTQRIIVQIPKECMQYLLDGFAKLNTHVLCQRISLLGLQEAPSFKFVLDTAESRNNEYSYVPLQSIARLRFNSDDGFTFVIDIITHANLSLEMMFSAYHNHFQVGEKKRLSFSQFVDANRIEQDIMVAFAEFTRSITSFRVNRLFQILNAVVPTTARINTSEIDSKLCVQLSDEHTGLIVNLFPVRPKEWRVTLNYMFFESMPSQMAGLTKSFIIVENLLLEGLDKTQIPEGIAQSLSSPSGMLLGLRKETSGKNTDNIFDALENVSKTPSPDILPDNVAEVSDIPLLSQFGLHSFQKILHSYICFWKLSEEMVVNLELLSVSADFFISDHVAKLILTFKKLPGTIELIFLVAEESLSATIHPELIGPMHQKMTGWIVALAQGKLEPVKLLNTSWQQNMIVDWFYVFREMSDLIINFNSTLQEVASEPTDKRPVAARQLAGGSRGKQPLFILKQKDEGCESSLTQAFSSSGSKTYFNLVCFSISKLELLSKNVNGQITKIRLNLAENELVFSGEGRKWLEVLQILNKNSKTRDKKNKKGAKFVLNPKMKITLDYKILFEKKVLAEVFTTLATEA